MKKLFISQPMNGLTDEEILNKRKEVKEIVEKKIGEEVEVLDSFFENFNPIGNIPVAFLGKSISLLAKADIVYFAGEWECARGCLIEYRVALAYGMNIIND